MRIISDELWARVKRRQLTTLENFSRTTTNRLEKLHAGEIDTEQQRKKPAAFSARAFGLFGCGGT